MEPDDGTDGQYCTTRVPHTHATLKRAAAPQVSDLALRSILFFLQRATNKPARGLYSAPPPHTIGTKEKEKRKYEGYRLSSAIQMRLLDMYGVIALVSDGGPLAP